MHIVTVKAPRSEVGLVDDETRLFSDPPPGLVASIVDAGRAQAQPAHPKPVRVYVRSQPGLE